MASGRKPARLPFASLSKAKRIVITFHSQGDLDAVGAAIALQRFLGKKAIIAPPDKPNASARRFLDHTQTQTTPFEQARVNEHDFLIALDSSSPVLMRHLTSLPISLLIDHHKAKPGARLTAKHEIIDESASSACEMLHFLIRKKDRVSAAALLMGIISDTAAFRYATPRAFEASGGLLSLSGLSYSQLLSLAVAPESFSERLEALRSCPSVSADRVGERIMATAMAKSHEAHFANLLVSLGADVAFVGCEAGSEARISARMRHSMEGKVHLEAIMEEAGRVLSGFGSGHEFAAGASGTEKENLSSALAVSIKLAEQQLLLSESGRIKKIEW